jgi:hypothetical protein
MSQNPSSAKNPSSAEIHLDNSLDFSGLGWEQWSNSKVACARGRVRTINDLVFTHWLLFSNEECLVAMTQPCKLSWENPLHFGSDPKTSVIKCIEQ